MEPALLSSRRIKHPAESMENPLERAANRRGLEAEMIASATNRPLIASMSDINETLCQFGRQCKFCGDLFAGAPFDPRKLFQARAHAAATPPLAVAMDANEDDYPDDDDADFDEDTELPAEMEIGGLPAKGATMPIEMRLVGEIKAMPNSCCSGACWMAESLARHGESSALGRVLVKEWPSLHPSKIGGLTLQRYTNRRSILAAEVMESYWRRVHASQTLPLAADPRDHPDYVPNFPSTVPVTMDI